MTEANTAPDNLESTMRRIKKLLAIAEDSRGDPNECAAAARMAESIMRKFQIEHADVISAELQREDAFDSTYVGTTMDPEGASKEAAGWAGILAVAVAKLYDCQARYCWSAKHGKSLKFSGYKLDTELARQTYVFIVNNMAAASRVYLKENRWAGRVEGNAFRNGYITGARMSINELIREKKAEMQQASSSRSLVLVKANAVSERFGKVKYRQSSDRVYQSDSFSAGRDKGSKLDVGRRGVGNSSASRALIGA